MPADDVVIDANVAIGLAAANRLHEFARDRSLVAPPLFWSEVRSALHAEGARAGTADECLRLLGAILDAAIDRIEVADPLAPWEVADQHRWTKTYDAEYLALAHQRGCELATVDRQLLRAARADGVAITRIA